MREERKETKREEKGGKERIGKGRRGGEKSTNERKRNGIWKQKQKVRERGKRDESRGDWLGVLR